MHKMEYDKMANHVHSIDDNTSHTVNDVLERNTPGDNSTTTRSATYYEVTLGGDDKWFQIRKEKSTCTNDDSGGYEFDLSLESKIKRWITKWFRKPFHDDEAGQGDCRMNKGSKEKKRFGLEETVQNTSDEKPQATLDSFLKEGPKQDKFSETCLRCRNNRNKKTKLTMAGNPFKRDVIAQPEIDQYCIACLPKRKSEAIYLKTEHDYQKKCTVICGCTGCSQAKGCKKSPSQSKVNVKTDIGDSSKRKSSFLDNETYSHSKSQTNVLSDERKQKITWSSFFGCPVSPVCGNDRENGKTEDDKFTETERPVLNKNASIESDKSIHSSFEDMKSKLDRNEHASNRLSTFLDPSTPPTYGTKNCKICGMKRKTNRTSTSKETHKNEEGLNSNVKGESSFFSSRVLFSDHEREVPKQEQQRSTFLDHSTPSTYDTGMCKACASKAILMSSVSNEQSAYFMTEVNCKPCFYPSNETILDGKHLLSRKIDDPSLDSSILATSYSKISFANKSKLNRVKVNDKVPVFSLNGNLCSCKSAVENQTNRQIINKNGESSNGNCTFLSSSRSRSTNDGGEIVSTATEQDSSVLRGARKPNLYEQCKIPDKNLYNEQSKIIGLRKAKQSSLKEVHEIRNKHESEGVFGIPVNVSEQDSFEIIKDRLRTKYCEDDFKIKTPELELISMYIRHALKKISRTRKDRKTGYGFRLGFHCSPSNMFKRKRCTVYEKNTRPSACSNNRRAPSIRKIIVSGGGCHEEAVPMKDLEKENANDNNCKKAHTISLVDVHANCLENDKTHGTREDATTFGRSFDNDSFTRMSDNDVGQLKQYRRLSSGCCLGEHRKSIDAQVEEKLGKFGLPISPQENRLHDDCIYSLHEECIQDVTYCKCSVGTVTSFTDPPDAVTEQCSEKKSCDCKYVLSRSKSQPNVLCIKQDCKKTCTKKCCCRDGDCIRIYSGLDMFEEHGNYIHLSMLLPESCQESSFIGMVSKWIWPNNNVCPTQSVWTKMCNFSKT